MTKIVILGGGFAGLYTILDLCKAKERFEIVLIDRDNYFTFTPLLHEVATAGIRRNNAIYLLKEHLDTGRVRIVRGEIKSADLKKQVVKTSAGNFDYDYLVVGLGSRTHFFGIPGLRENTMPLKTIHDAEEIRRAVIEQFKKANKSDDPKERERLLTFVVIGAGSTGVELAAELKEFGDLLCVRQYHKICEHEFRVIILQRSHHMVRQLTPKLVNSVEKRLKKLGVELKYRMEVEKAGKDYLIASGQKIPCSIKIAATGVKANVIKTTPQIYDGEKGIPVHSNLLVHNFENVFALGDVALHENKNGEFSPRLAQVASRQGKVVAGNIIALVRGKPLKDYEFVDMGFLLSVGQKYAVAKVFGLFFRGFFAWWLWRTIYLLKVVGLKNKLYLAWDWTVGLFRKRFVKKIVKS